MKVNSKKNNDITFQGFWSNKAVKKGLEFASNNGALFAATTTLALSAGVRPLAITFTPKTNKENKKIACAKSIASGILEFALTLAISAPIAFAFKKIDKNPEKYLKKETISNLKENSANLKESKAYSLATQMFKLGLGFAVVVPKAILTTLGIPVVLEKCFNKNKKTKKEKQENQQISFQGKASDKLANGLGKIIDNASLQSFSKKYQDSNFPMHIFALKDSLATFAFISLFNKNKNIKEEQKPFLTKNSVISTALSIVSGYTIDKMTDKKAQKILEKIKSENKNDPNLAKLIEGFKIVKPVFILAVIYYTLIPMLSSFLAQKSEDNKKN